MRLSPLQHRDLVIVLAVLAAWGAVSRGDMPPPSDADVAALIEQLGADDYAARERAAAQLDGIGAAAIDSLLAAAESTSGRDLEVSLRAQWLAAAIPMIAPGDDPRVVTLLQEYRRQSFNGRVKLMRQLLRVDYDAGIEPLARIVRLERDPTESRIAAAMLAGEWTPDDPTWPALQPRILAGLGTSTRRAAALLRTVALFSQAVSADERIMLARQGRDLLPGLERIGRSLAPPSPDEPPADAAVASQPMFERSVVQMLVRAGLDDEATEIVRTRLEGNLALLPQADGQAAAALIDTIADTLIWSSMHGLADVGEMVKEATIAGVGRKPILYAAAACARARGRATEATRLADAAFADGEGDGMARVQTGLRLVQWGQSDWASREFQNVLDDPEATPLYHAYAAIQYSEHLHDQGRNGEAVDVLRAVLEPARDEAGHLSALLRLGRDPVMTRSRMHFFAACAAATRGDEPGQRQALEAALSSTAKDVDAVIAMHALPDTSEEHRAHVRRLIAEMVKRIDGQIEAIPEDTQARNEWAWLVANTEGDVAKAIAYSRATLEASPDNAAYLDTLAHCHAAANDYDLAIRAQRLAHRLEPHNRLIRLNLEKFESLAAAAPGEAR